MSDKIKGIKEYSGTEAEEYFNQVSQIMQKNFEITKITTKHKGRRGTEGEETLKIFLHNYLPKRFSVGSGFVLTQSGERSKELDVIIFDSFHTPTLYYRETHQILPIECVFATIEVKSYLNKKAIIKAAKNVSSVKKLRRTIGKCAKDSSKEQGKKKVGGFVFAFSAVSLISLKKNLNDYYLENDVPLSERIDSICILNKGLMFIDKNRELVAYHTGLSSLWVFYAQLLEALNSIDIIRTDLSKYISTDKIFPIVE